MSAFERIEELLDTLQNEALDVLKQSEELYEVHLQSLLDKVKRDCEAYKSSGVLPVDAFNFKAAEKIVLNGKGQAKEDSTGSSRASSTKENDSEVANQIQPQKSSRTTRTTAKSNRPEMVKLFDKVVIKMERISEDLNIMQTDNIKKENDIMPPPSRLPAKRTRTRKASQSSNSASSNIDMCAVVIKKENIDNNVKQGRESVVIVESNNILNVTINESDEEAPPTKLKSRNRTKKRQLKNGSSSEENESDNKKQRQEVDSVVRSTRSRLKDLSKVDIEHQQLKEIPSELNKTVLIGKPNNLNTTIVISKHAAANETFIMNKNPLPDVEKQLLTDDEEVIDNSVKETKTNRKKPIFSPFAGSPVKKRVAAFEKLGIAQTENQLHSTRAKTKKLVEKTGSQDDESPPSNDNNKKTGIPKLRATPMVENRMLPQATSVERLQNNTNGPKSKSALKSSQAEFRDRELRRKQLEKDALLKKEALINAEIEEKRRRNEERQIKAKQQRDALEKEKQQLLEAAENAKLNKIKQATAERDDKLQKQKEEALKKRQMVLKKAALEKQKEENRKLEEAKKNNNKKVAEMPLLPTPDCYDSDDSVNANKRIEKPAWQNGRSLHSPLKAISCLGEIVKKLFSTRPQNPDIDLILPGSKPVTRNSSVIWDTSNVSKFPSMIEEEEE